MKKHFSGTYNLHALKCAKKADVRIILSKKKLWLYIQTKLPVLYNVNVTVNIACRFSSVCSDSVYIYSLRPGNSYLTYITL